MRSLVAMVLGAAALLAGLATMPAAWVAHNIANEDGYVSFTEPLAKDPALHRALAEAISSGLVQQADVPEFLRPAAKTAISAATIASARTPGFVKAWDQTQRQSHKIMLGDPRSLPAELDATNRLAVDLGPMSAFMVEQVNKTLPVQISAPSQMIVNVGGNSANTSLEQIRKTPGWEHNGIVAIIVLAGLCVIVAKRRALAVALMGLGAVAVAAGLHEVSATVIPKIRDDNTATTALAKPMLDLLATRAGDSFDQWLATLAVGGAIAAVAGVVVTVRLSARGKASSRP